MPYCPKCKAEYREGFKKCTDCNVDLVDKLPISYKKNRREEIAPPPKGIELKKLVNASNDIELSYIVSLLENDGIEYRLVGTGKSITYMDIYFKGLILAPKRVVYVDKSKINEARAIVMSIAGDSKEE